MIQPETINSMGGDSGVYENDGDFVRRSDAISVLEKISEGKLLSCPICGGRAKIRKIRVEESLVKRYKYRAFCWGIS